jgi:gliding motility-associated-like protein
VILIVTTSNGCVDSLKKTIHIDPLVVASVSNDTVTCYGELVELRASGGLWYHWEPWQLVVYTDSHTTYVAPATTTTFTVTVTDSCSSDTATVTVFINQLPTLEVSNDTSIYLGGEAHLWAHGYPDVIDYTWSPTHSIIAPSTEEDPTITVKPDQTTTYTVTVTDVNGCQKTDFVTVKILESLITVPNAFSPNGDNENEEVYVITLGDVTINYFKIYNRWGELVFETNGVGPGTGWDGTFRSQQQPVGVFTYIVSVPDGPHQSATYISGNISLLR